MVESNIDLPSSIRRLAREKNAAILAHYYQSAEVQDIADFVGDSLALAKQAAASSADILVMCGVHFMGETAAMLCPEKRVLLPEPSAGCSLADSCDADALKAWKAKHPDYWVVSYVNTTAAVKALSDIVVTSSNALRIVNSFPVKAHILFGPDRHLGAYIAKKTGRDLQLWDGGCHVHSRFDAQALEAMRREHPLAKVLAHPECSEDILAQADIIGSTQDLLQAVEQSMKSVSSSVEQSMKSVSSSVEQSAQGAENLEFIVATEPGVLHAMHRAAPTAVLMAVPAIGGGCNECEGMRTVTLQKVYDCLLHETGRVTIDPHILPEALLPIRKMMEF